MIELVLFFLFEHVGCWRLLTFFFEHVGYWRLLTFLFLNMSDAGSCFPFLSMPFTYACFPFLNISNACDCRLGLAFPGADPSTNQRFDETVVFIEALVDFPVQLIPRESRPYGYLALTFQKRRHVLFHTVRLYGNLLQHLRYRRDMSVHIARPDSEIGSLFGIK
ncbi:hypothetical protein [Staphylococcus delphini]|uniref:hypothetical protein n=1 Tax=Staphylococcus delphini TaxID=53344 RepID=UPI0023B32BD6|nr:hypothetical protein [Staphylococcus delphini]MDE9798421.1 hypothetical protein [Staphylococcus delphini]MDE9805662.1 hypothetical protein [Staphylococcus delphini]